MFMFTKFSLKPCKFHQAHVIIVLSALDMISSKQRIGHMIVIGHPTNLDVWSVTIH